MSRLWTHETRVPYESQDHWESKALATTLNDTELEDDSKNEDDGILNAFTATVNPTERIDEEMGEEEDLGESKFEKIDEQDDIHTAYAKLYKVSETHEKLYSSMIWSLNEKKSPQILIKLIKLLEHYGLKTIS